MIRHTKLSSDPNPSSSVQQTPLTHEEPEIRSLGLVERAESLGLRQRESTYDDARNQRSTSAVQQMAPREPMPIFELPTDFARNPNRAGDMATFDFEISKDRIARIHGVAREARIGVHDWLLTIWSILLYRYTSCAGFVVSTSGCTTTARVDTLLDSLHASYDSLHFQLDPTHSATFLAEAVSRCRLQTIEYEAIEHETIEHEAIELGHAQRRSSDEGQSLNYVRVLFSFDGDLRGDCEPRLEEPRPARLNGFPLDASSANANIELAMSIESSSNNTVARIAYRMDLWRPSNIERMTTHFQTLLESSLQSPNMGIAELKMLCDEEWHRLVVEWNDNAIAFPLDRCVHGLIHDQALKTPDAIAVVCGEEQLTYRELDRKSNQLARHLGSLGIVPGSLVGLCVEQSAQVIVGILGILKSGAAYVPLDIHHPAERVQTIVSSAGFSVLVTSTRNADRLPESIGQLVNIDSFFAGPSERVSTELYEVPVAKDDLAYVLFTSGTTGKPKGVAIPHRAVVNFLCAMAIQPGMKPGERLLSITSPTFDISVLEMLLPLIVGAAVEIVPTHDIKDPAALAAALQKSDATMMQATPTTRQMMVLHGWKGHPNLQLVTGGEALSNALASELLQRCDQLWNQYGPTETTVYMTQHRVPPGGPNGIIGKPIANCQVYVLDPVGNVLPIGVPGEIFVGGEPLARGYLNQDELTAEKFIPHPFSTEPSARIYHTGDLGRWLEGGVLECMGRLDHQVKLRGYRIELKEIESHLNQFPGIKESIVRLREDQPGDQRLVAFCVVPQPPNPDAADVLAYLRTKVPDYMVPAAIVWMSSLPLTVNGKIDLRALPVPENVRPDWLTEYAPPRDAYEVFLSEIFQSILGVKQIGIHDDFFALGAHSLTLVKAAVRIREQSQCAVRVRMFFDHPTIASLAECLKNEFGDVFQDGGDRAIQPTLRDNRSLVTEQRDEVPLLVPQAPLSFAQLRLWLVDQIEGGLSAYNIPKAYRIRGPLNRTWLKRAVETIIERHQPLRTVYRMFEGQPCQIVEPADHWALPVHEIVVGPETDPIGVVQREFTREADQPFLLDQDLALRASLYKLSESDHVFMFNMHHIASDEWSVDLFLRELSIAYDAFAREATPILPELPICYSQYAQAQRAILSGARYDSLLQFWKNQLADLPTLEIPTDRPRPMRQSYSGGQCRVQYSPELVERLNKIAKDRHVTLHMLLLAAFQTLLHKHTGQSDLALGMPVAGRLDQAWEPLIGFFVNTLVIRTDLSGDPTFSALLQRTRTSCLATYDHQEMPFDKLVEEIRPKRTLNSNPLVQMIFQLTTMENTQLHFDGLDIQALDLDEPRVRFDLEVHLAQTDGGVRGAIHYAKDLFDASTIQRLSDHFHTILCSIATDPDQRLSELEWISEEEKRRVLIDWNETSLLLPSVSNAFELFEEQVRKTPNATAIEYDGQTLTYVELQQRSENIAASILGRCNNRPKRVAVLLERSLDLVAGILGVLRSGAAYVPMDPAYPAKRLAFMLQDSQPELLLTQTKLAATAAPFAIATLCLDAEDDTSRVRDFGDSESLANAISASRSSDVAYVLYTSGSTGQPKGVEMPHRAMINLIAWHQQEPRLKVPARTLQFASCNFDVSIQEIHSTLCTGGTLVMVAEEVRRDPEELWDTLQRERIERLFVPFVMLQQLAIASGNSPAPLIDIISAGESLKFTPEVRHLLQKLSGCRLHNHYGPTETHVVTSQWVDHDILMSMRESPIGLPIANTQVYVLDARMCPQPPGVPGDLWIAGECLALGYAGQVEMTNSRFVPTELPFVGKTRLYRTGDRAHWNSEGVLVFDGRNDDQIKHRGFRIELGEIEAVLHEHPSVDQAAVALKSGPSGAERLVAYYVARSGSISSPSQLQAFLRDRLPEFMHPSAFVRMESLPLTATGKLDRRALPAPNDSNLREDEDFVAPETEMEVALARIWSELLGLERISAQDHFFALGGHSLLAARVRSRIAGDLGARVTLRTLFEFPVLRELANFIESAPRMNEDARTVSHSLRSGLDRGPLSFSQQRLWFLEEMEGPLTAYNMQFAWQLSGKLDVKALERSVQSLVDRHESLRTVFDKQEDELVQFVQCHVHVDCLFEDISQLDADEQRIRCDAIIESQSIRPFDLSRDVLLRAHVIRVSSHLHVFSVTVHHIAFDGWSSDVFFRELSKIYSAYSSNADPSLPAVPMQYLDYALRQRKELNGDRLNHLLDHWGEKLNGLTPLELPTDRPRPAEPSNRGDWLPIQLEPQLVSPLRELALREGTTLQITMMAAFQLLLARYARSEDVAVGTISACRHDSLLESLVGFVANTLVVRTNLRGNPKFIELLRRTHVSSMDAYAHDDLPFERLVEHLKPERDRSRNPLVQTLLQVLPQDEAQFELAGIAVNRIPTQIKTSRFDIELHAWEDLDALRGYVVFSTDLFDRSTMDAMVERLMGLLRQIAEDPQRRIGDYEFVTNTEKKDLLHTWNDTDRPFPEVAIHDLFRRIASLEPSRIALVDHDRTWTYGEVDAASDYWAQRMLALGAGHGSKIALLLERSADLILGMLSALKVGGCYVPLDPEYPVSRIENLLEQTGANLVVTHSRLQERLQIAKLSTLLVDQDLVAFGTSNGDAVLPKVVSSDLAYILFTSGSTGTPKGVCVEHRSIARLVFGNDYATFGPDRVFLQLAPAAFDAATLEIWGALLHGAKLVIAPPDKIPDFERLGQQIREHGVTTLWLTASLFNQWIEDAPSSLSTVQEILTGGEALSVGPIRLAQSLLGERVQLINGYGPTECTTFATCNRIPHSIAEECTSIPIGRPIGNTRAWILDDHQQLMPPGVIGELYLGGPGLAREYLNDVTLTEERFVACPWPEPGYERMYRTGDLCLWRRDGLIEYTGRADDQIKIRGFRIELGEIENHVAKVRGVARCVALMRQDNRAGKSLIAYVLPEHGQSIDVGTLRTELHKQLPSYMIPSLFVPVESIPLTQNGKVDKRSLLALAASASSREEGSVGPRSDIEDRVVEIWQDVFGKESIGVHDNFFDLGGHSLMAVRMFSQIDKRFGIKPPLALLFQHGTVAQLSKCLEGYLGKNDFASIVPLQKEGTGNPLILLPSLGGELLHHKALLERFGNAFPVIGLQANLDSTDLAHLGSIENTARRYIEVLRAYQARGPYRLGGFSYGGFLAFEIARQLLESGETVDYLAVIDTGPYESGDGRRIRSKLSRLKRVITNFPRWLNQEIRHTPWKIILGSVQRKLRYGARWIKTGGNTEIRFEDVFDSPRIATQDSSAMRMAFDSVQAYTPRPYSGELQLFRARTRPLLSGSTVDLGWSQFVDSVVVHNLPGNHETLFQSPSVDLLAAAILEEMAKRNRLDIPSTQ